MKLSALRPSAVFLKLLLALLLSALILPAFSLWFEGATAAIFQWLSLYLLGLLLGLASFDAWISRSPANISLERELPNILSVYYPQKVKISLRNESSHSLRLAFQEKLPNDWDELSQTNSPFVLKPDEKRSFSYEIRPRRRGPCTIEGCFFRLNSSFRLWDFTWFKTHPSEHKIYPNFSALSDLSGLHGSVNLHEMGLRKFNLRGSGMDFLQLRDYREGESLRQIDWRASSRFKRLISKEFQEEKNQHVLLMVDAGRRMRVQDDELSYFDRSLQALTLLSFTALKHGDHISIQSFGGNSRWLNQVRGVKNVSRVMHHFYDLYPEKVASDYLSAAQALMEKHPKRSLVILVTCLRDEDFDDLMQSVRLLQDKHLVAVISIKEPIYEHLSAAPIDTLEDALSYSASINLSRSIETNIKRLRHHGVICMQSEAQHLSSDLINSYLSIKKSGIL